MIFRSHLLARSETFIAAQATALSRYRPAFLGLRRVEGLPVPGDECIVSERSPLRSLGAASLVAFGRSATARRWIREHRPALLHAHFGPDGAAIEPFARTEKIPLVVTFHGYDATFHDAAAARSFRLHRLYLRRRRALQRHAARFLAVSDFIRDCLIAQGFPADRIATHYTGINLRLFTPDIERSRTPSVLFVGRLVPKKGCEYLIRAMAGVQAEHPDAVLRIVGAGPLRTDLERLASALRIRCEFLGAQPPTIVRTLMNESMVFSVPSIRADSGDAEGFGMVFAEAQAMGLPVATFASGGIPEAVSHDVTGLLGPEKDVPILRTNISRLLSDNDLWTRMSLRGRSRVAELFDIERQTRRLESHYDAARELAIESPDRYVASELAPPYLRTQARR